MELNWRFPKAMLCYWRVNILLRALLRTIERKRCWSETRESPRKTRMPIGCWRLCGLHRAVTLCRAPTIFQLKGRPKRKFWPEMPGSRSTVQWVVFLFPKLQPAKLEIIGPQLTRVVWGTRGTMNPGQIQDYWQSGMYSHGDGLKMRKTYELPYFRVNIFII